MKNKLIIVESPSKCAKIEAYAGSEYKCLATCGHIYSLDKLRDIDIENNYKPNYREMKTKKKNLDAIKKYITGISSEDIFLATDPDREGEAIAWHICQHFNLNILTTKRIVFNEITKTAICHSLNNPRTIDMNMVKSQQARQTIDVIVGFKTCPILWKHLGIGDTKSPISAGRCQTPCLKLVYDLYNREKEKNVLVKYKLNAYVDISKSLDNIENIKNIENIDNLLCFSHILSSSHNKEEIMNILSYIGKYCDFNISRTAPKKTQIKAPKPLTTSLLQQKANQYMGMSPNITMKTAQKLYEKGLITYMRTDSQRYSRDFISSAIDYINKNSQTLFSKTNKPCKPCSVKDYIIDDPYMYGLNTSKKENSQDGHESVRPTCLDINIREVENITPIEVKLYNYIYIHSLQTFIKDAIVEGYTIVSQPVYNALYEDKNTNKSQDINAYNSVLLKSSIRHYSFIGWKSIKSQYNSQESDNIEGTEESNDDAFAKIINTDIYSKYLNVLTDTNTRLLIKNAELKSIHAMPFLSSGAAYYSEANLVKDLEEKQIGRPSTYASLVDKIQSRHYVFKMDINKSAIETTKYEYYNTHKRIVELSKCALETPLIKNRLVIQDLGKNVTEFCYQYFDSLFNYDYTASLEKMLDKIANGETTYETVCKICDTMVETCIKNINLKKESTLSDNIETFTKQHTNEKTLGVYNDTPIIIKSGIYGYYAQYGKEKHSLRHMNIIDIDDFKYDDVVSFIERKQQDNDEKLIRTIDDKISIWKGVKGKSDYIMIKAAHNKHYKHKAKPQFISLKSFKDDYINCDIERIKEFIKEKIEK